MLARIRLALVALVIAASVARAGDPPAGDGVRDGGPGPAEQRLRIDAILGELGERARARDAWDAAKRLSLLGGEAAPLLASRLEDADEVARLALANALCLAGELGAGRRALLELARAALDPEVRAHAARSVGVTRVRTGLEHVAEALSHLLGAEGDPFVKTAIADSMLRISPGGRGAIRAPAGLGALFSARVRARKALIEIMAGPDERAAREAALVLGENGEEGFAAERLAALAGEPTEEGRRARLVLKAVRPSRAELLDEISRKIEGRYVNPDKVDRDELVNAAAKGMARSLDDFSDYLTEEEMQGMDEMLDNHYEGIGAWVGLRDSFFTIISPVYDGPAYRAGLRSLDRILEVDGVRTGDLGFQKTIKRLKGPKGTRVEVKIARRGWSEPQTFVIVRDEIRIENCYARMLPDGIGYVKLVRFTRDAGSEVRKRVSDLVERGARGLVFDLRDNGGGLLSEAVEVADVFLGRLRGERERVIVYSEGRPEVAPLRRFFTKSGDALGGRPLVVLVNSGSASASEIVSGSLQDWGRARLVGAVTFGKGSVQSIMPLSATNLATSLRLTIARYYLPSQRSIDKHGVEPAVKVEEETLPGWESEEIVRLRLREKIGEHVRNAYAASAGEARELYEKLAEDDGKRLDSYPGLRAFVEKLVRGPGPSTDAGAGEKRHDEGDGERDAKRGDERGHPSPRLRTPAVASAEVGGTHVSEDAMRRLAREAVRRLVQDARGRTFVCDLQEDLVLRRGVREVLVELDDVAQGAPSLVSPMSPVSLPAPTDLP